MHTIGFPGIGIGDFELNDVAFELPFFKIDVAWYGIIITCGIVFAVIYAYLASKKERLIFDDLIDVTFFAVIPGIIGARLYYIFFDWLKNPSDYNSFFDVINIRGGGLAIYGGLIFGALGCLIMLKIKKINMLKFFDNIAPGVMVAQAIGRWGNFFNAEAYGGETTLPWRMRISTPYSVIEVHPTFLYESLWNVIGFVIITLFVRKRKKFDGQVLLFYAGWYGFGRMIIEGLRQDSLYIGNTGFRISQLVAAFCFVASLALTIYFSVGVKAKAPAECIYLTGSKKYNAVMGITEDSAHAGDTATAAASAAEAGTEDGADKSSDNTGEQTQHSEKDS